MAFSPSLCLYLETFCTFFLLDPLLYWADQVYITLASDFNQSIAWTVEPWTTIGTEIYQERTSLFLHFTIALSMLGVFLLFLAIGSALVSLDNCYKDSLLSDFKQAISPFTNRFTFTEPSIAYHMREFTDYFIIFWALFPMYRPSFFSFLVFTTFAARIGHWLSSAKLLHLLGLLMLDAAFFSILYFIPYPLIVRYFHVIEDSNFACYLIRYYIISRLAQKYCNYWFVVVVRKLPAVNSQIEQKLITYKSNIFLLDDVVELCFGMIHYCFCKEFNFQPSRPNHIFLIEEVFFSVTIVCVYILEPQLGSNCPLILSFAFGLFVHIYMNRDYLMPFAGGARRWPVANFVGAVVCLTVNAVCIQYYPMVNCSLALLISIVFSNIAARFYMLLLKTDKKQAFLLILDTAVAGFIAALVFVIHNVIPTLNFKKVFLAQLGSDLVYIVLLAASLMVASWFTSFQDVSFERIFYRKSDKNPVLPEDVPKMANCSYSSESSPDVLLDNKLNFIIQQKLQKASQQDTSFSV